MIKGPGGKMLELEQTIKFTTEDIDKNGVLKASSLLHAYQDIASDHADALGVGYDELIKKDWIWVLSKVKYEIYGSIEPDAEYRLSTYPRPKKGAAFPRDFYLNSKDGSTVAAGTSMWCVMNFATRKLERSGVDFDGECIGYAPFDEGIEKIRSRQPVQAGIHKVTEADLDVNRHVNNSRYADMAGDVLGTGGFSGLVMNFLKEAVLGDEILLYREEQEDGIVVAGKLEDGTTIFQALIQPLT